MKKEIARESILKVRILMQSIFPKAASMNYIRGITGIGNRSIRIICEELINTEVIDSTAGKLYRWREKGA